MGDEERLVSFVMVIHICRFDLFLRGFLVFVDESSTVVFSLTV